MTVFKTSLPRSEAYWGITKTTTATTSIYVLRVIFVLFFIH